MSINSAIAQLTPQLFGVLQTSLEAFIAGETLDAQIAGIYSFAEAAQALRHAGQTGEGRSGKVILTPTKYVTRKSKNFFLKKGLARPAGSHKLLPSGA